MVSSLRDVTVSTTFAGVLAATGRQWNQHRRGMQRIAVAV
jgi:hypothetical protein